MRVTLGRAYERDISIGQAIEVIDRQPFGGPVTARIGGVEHVLGENLASVMRVA